MIIDSRKLLGTYALWKKGFLFVLFDDFFFLWILLFSNNAFNWSEMRVYKNWDIYNIPKVSTSIVLQTKGCSFEL